MQSSLQEYLRYRNVTGLDYTLFCGVTFNLSQKYQNSRAAKEKEVNAKVVECFDKICKLNQTLNTYVNERKRVKDYNRIDDIDLQIGLIESEISYLNGCVDNYMKWTNKN